jgi:hypothetical protein
MGDGGQKGDQIRIYPANDIFFEMDELLLCHGCQFLNGKEVNFKILPQSHIGQSEHTIQFFIN